MEKFGCSGSNGIMLRRMFIRTAAISAVTALPLVGGSTAHAAADYHLVQLGLSSGGTFSYATAISNQGQIVGWFPSAGYPYAFLYSNGSVRDLGTLGGSFSYAAGINDSGQVVGWSDTSTGNQFGFFYNSGTGKMSRLGGIDQAFGINDGGEIVGTNGTNAVVYSNGMTTAVAALPGNTFSVATAVNNGGQVVGWTSITDNGNSVASAFLYNAGTTTYLGKTIGASSSYATSINASGQIVGYSVSSTTLGSPPVGDAFIYSDGLMASLGVLPGDSLSSATSINASGQVVGYSESKYPSTSHAFLWTSSGGMQDLNYLVDPGSGWTLRTATGINKYGDIVGAGTNPSGGYEAFLLAPTTTTFIGPAGGDWNTANNWSSFIVPQGGDDVTISIDGTVNFDANYDSSTSLGSFTIDNTAGGTANLSQANGSLQADNEIIGDAGSGSFDQSGGSNTVSSVGSLVLGSQSGGTGIYDLSGAGTLNAAQENIGDSGTGQFIQSDGANTVTDSGAGLLDIGVVNGANSAALPLATGDLPYNYVLTGGSLQADREIVGDGGYGSFYQDGGSNTVAVTSGAGASGILTLGDLSGAAGVYLLGGTGELNAAEEDIGSLGTGQFVQSGGTNAVADGSGNGILDIGVNAGANFAALPLVSTFPSTPPYNYVLTGGSLQADNEIVGDAGSGSFYQDGGSNMVAASGTLALGGQGSGVGVYLLGGGTLGSSEEDIGSLGTGQFIQSGGTDTVTDGTGNGAVDIGVNAVSNSGALPLLAGEPAYNYVLSGGTLQSDNEIVGDAGNGSFYQSGGNNNVVATAGVDSSGSLTLGSQSGATGLYLLGDPNNIGEVTLSAASEIVGEAGSGAFYQSGGGNTVSLSGALVLGDQNSGTGLYSLSGTGTLNAPEEDIGSYGTGQFIQSGGTNTVTDGTGNGALEIGVQAGGNSGTLPLVSGGPIYNYVLTGGTLSADNEVIGDSGNGSFYQAGGSNTVTAAKGVDGSGTLTLAANPGAIGVYSLDGGSLVAATINLNTGGIFNQNNGINGESNNATLKATAFNQDGGTVNGTLQNQGTFTYTSGAFTGRLINQGSVDLGATTNVFVAGNGIENDGTLSVLTGQTITTNGKGLLNKSTVNLSGGTLNGNALLINDGTIFGYGTLTSAGLANGTVPYAGNITFTGGATRVNGPVANDYGSTISIQNITATFTGNVTNNSNATVYITGATTYFTGTYTDNGRTYFDPSTAVYNNWTVGTTGITGAGTGDLIAVKGNFMNNSQQATGWNTAQATLEFTGGGSHNMAVAGSDLGDSQAGFTNNFAWGQFILDSGNALVLSDGTGVTHGAFYTNILTLGGGLGQLSSITSNGINIYYDSTNSANAYLNGQTYSLAGGGELAPAPEPATLAMFVLGGLLLLGRQKCCKMARKQYF